MKVFLINAHTRTVEPVCLPDKDRLDTIYKLLDCRLIDVINVGENDLTVDDEGLLMEPNRQRFFMYFGTFDLSQADEETGRLIKIVSFRVAGNALFTGYDQNGNMAEPTISIEQFRRKIVFMGYSHGQRA
ncbi:DUF3846 domain-containing protein [Runella slithyformis]|uniref:DUF3846 domain-containing protein n=1 Tax=Runella slithyformis (strain ATCC 29530 / DSM 19594 / LMG 11500 / NCIMB 11436 / LSU 4) TaxID=761193 RepID=A0A7U3ZRR9_RUNSL|nr:hypothetical protein [Runella slithyformis]AEI52176.1 hypothetical protein Runsl_5880 [Runella slithyformis DSM 19594]